jgi:hypothetical protein
MDTTSIEWWAQTLNACHDALRESRAARLDFEVHGATKSAEKIAVMARQEERLKQLENYFLDLCDRNRLPPLL